MDGERQQPSTAEPERQLVASIDPLIVEAAREVDGTLLDWMLGLSPRERLRACSNASRALGRFSDGTPSPR
jgi:hypothetical protein